MKRLCQNVIDIDGCSCHKGNLIIKELNKKFQIVKDVVFLDALSNFIQNRPNVRSILKQTNDYFQVNKTPDYCETRFLNPLYTVLEVRVACHQFPVIENFGRLESENSQIKECLNQKELINTDQFVTHLKQLREQFYEKTSFIEWKCMIVFYVVRTGIETACPSWT